MAEADILPEVRTLLAKQACSELVLGVARAYDRVDRELLVSLFWPDAAIDYGSFKGDPEGLADWAFAVITKVFHCQHIVTNIQVNVWGDKAASEACFWAYHQMAAEEGRFLFVAGRYLDSFEQRDGVWKMSGRKAVAEVRTHAVVDPQGGAKAYPLRGPEDPSYAHMRGEG